MRNPFRSKRGLARKDGKDDARNISDVLASGKSAALLTVENARMITGLSVVEEMAEDGCEVTFDELAGRLFYANTHDFFLRNETM